MADDASRICLSGSPATSAAAVSAVAPRQDVKNSGSLAGSLSFPDPLSLAGGLSSSPVSAAPVPRAVFSGGFPPAAAAHLVVPAASAVASGVSLVSPGRMPVLNRGTAAAGMASVAVSRLDAPDSTMSFSGLLLAEIASSRCQAPVARAGLVPSPQQQSDSTAPAATAAASIALPAAPVGATPQQQQSLRGVSADDFRPSQTRVASVTPGAKSYPHLLLLLLHHFVTTVSFLFLGRKKQPWKKKRLQSLDLFFLVKRSKSQLLQLIYFESPNSNQILLCSLHDLSN
jgi:hypothetical protein